MPDLWLPTEEPARETDQLILIIEDDAEQRELLKLVVLRLVGGRVVMVDRGEAGLAIARQLKPDLVLLDLQLPHLDGFEVLRRLRTDPSTQAIPVIAVTALVGFQYQQAAFAAGCNDFVTKPFDVADLASVILHRVAARVPTGPVGAASL